jgi:hypothetical protein
MPFLRWSSRRQRRTGSGLLRSTARDGESVAGTMMDKRDVATAVTSRYGAARAAARRTLLGALAIGALGGAASPAPAVPLATGLQAATVQLDVIANGEGTVSVSPAQTPTLCDQTLRLPCDRYAYAPGQDVTLTATGAGLSTFVGWSDGRCPAGPTCSLPMDADRQSVTALFSLQKVLVVAGDAGTVTANDGTLATPRECTPEDPPNPNDALGCGDFPLSSRVTLHAAAADPNTDTVFWDGSLCDPPVAQPDNQADCTVSVFTSRWASVAFGPPDSNTVPDGIPTAVSVRFRVLKLGTGSGTVHSGSLNCGGACATEENFGERENLVADPAPGSTFTGWRGACSSAPTCSLAVGPVTAIGAVFDAPSTSNPPSSGSGPSRPSTRFAARLRRFAVSGHGRHRRILIRVQVNAPATVRATLSRGHRRVASRRWRVRAGNPLLRLRVPARARRGVYRLGLSMRDRAGHTIQVKRRVRLPR